MLKFYNYWRSSSSYRVRIALRLKLIPYQNLDVDLLRDGGEQHSEAFRQLNPQELVPVFVDDGVVLSQSLAMLGYLERRWPYPSLLPDAPEDVDAMWAFALAIASEIQPLQNTRVLGYLSRTLGVTDAAKADWLRHWIGLGLDAAEATLQQRARAHGETRYCFGDTPTIADCCLVPQLYAARRYDAVRDWPRLSAIDANCAEHPGFVAAHPDAARPG